MMRRTMLATLATLLLTAGAALAATSYGKGVTLREFVSIGDIVAKPDLFAGKTVAIKGLIVDVCETRGCWMELAGEKPGQTLRVKVEDGVIVFPVTLRGKKATVQGTLEAVRMCPDEALRHRRNEARAKGVPFDPNSVTGKESSFTLQVTGASVE